MRRTTTETNQEKWSHSVDKSFAGTFAALPSGLFVGHLPLGRGMAPSENLGKIGGQDKLLETEGDTHALPLRGAPSHNLNSHLKSIRNEGKKDRKSKRKRARRKDRSSENVDYLALEYLALD